MLDDKLVFDDELLLDDELVFDNELLLDDKLVFDGELLLDDKLLLGDELLLDEELPPPQALRHPITRKQKQTFMVRKLLFIVVYSRLYN